MFLSSWWNQSTSLRYQICQNAKESGQIHQWYQVRVTFSTSNFKILKGPNTHICRYAFVEFENSDECKAARGKLATTQFKGKELIVDFVGEVKIFFFLELLGPFPTMHHPGEQEQVTEGQIWGQGAQQIKPDQVDFLQSAQEHALQLEISPNILSNRLFICGLAPGVSKTNLKEMFPKVYIEQSL